MSSPQIDLVHKAIQSGIFGHIQFKPAAAELIRRDPDLKEFTPARIQELLRRFVLDGNSLDARMETRQEYLAEQPDHPFWYRAVMPVTGMPRGLFIELIIFDDDPEEPWVEIVSVHRQ